MVTAERKTGWMVSGAMHAAVLVLALIGADWFSGGDPRPLNVSSVELVDGAAFDAQLSTAPVMPNEGPAELSPPSETEAGTLEPAGADAEVEAPEMAPLPRPDPPTDAQPDFGNILFPPPPTPVPSEAPGPSIAEIPTPETLPRQAAEPESPPATEPLQPLASTPVPDPAPAPAPPPEPEPVAAEEPEPEPEEPEREPEPEAVAETQPEAPLAAAPQEARLPVAKPAEVAAAARAASAPEPVAPQPEESEPPEEPEQAEQPAPQGPERTEPEQAEPEAPEPEPQPAQPPGGSTSQFAATVTPGEKDALRLGIKQFFVYNGDRSDRSLRVTLEIELGRDASIVAGPELVRASGGDEGARQALFQAGRRALLKAENAGEFARLPPDKYDGWRLIHVTFTPEEIGFQS